MHNVLAELVLLLTSCCILYCGALRIPRGPRPSGQAPVELFAIVSTQIPSSYSFPLVALKRTFAIPQNNSLNKSREK